MATRRPAATQRITATAGPIDQAEEERRKKRGQGGRSTTQQAPWATPSSTATTTGGGGRNPFSSSVYARPAQTMQGPTVASFSAGPKKQRDDQQGDLWRRLTGVAASTPSSPGGTGTGGMFMPTFTPGQGGRPGIAIGGGAAPSAPPSTGFAGWPGITAPTPPSAAPRPPGLGSIPIPGRPGPTGPGGGKPSLPMPPGGLGSILGAIMPNLPKPPGMPAAPPSGPTGSQGKPPGQLGSRPVKPQLPPVSAFLPPQMQSPQAPQLPQTPQLPTQGGGGYQTTNPGGPNYTPPGSIWDPNRAGYGSSAQQGPPPGPNGIPYGQPGWQPPNTYNQPGMPTSGYNRPPTPYMPRGY